MWISDRSCPDTKEKLDPCASSIIYQRNALRALDGEFVEAATFMTTQVRDDKFMGHLVPRKQCTFGPVQYKQYQLISDTSRWPALVTRVLDATIDFARQLGVDNPQEYNAVHGNFYPNGHASVQKHADDAIVRIPGAPTSPYTYIPDDDASEARA